MGTASHIAAPLGDQRVSSSIRGDEHEQGSRAKYHTHASCSTPSRRFGGFPRATHGAVAAALSWGVLRAGRPFWLLGAAFGCGRAPGDVSVSRTLRSMQESYRRVMWAIRERICAQQGGWERPKHRTKACGRCGAVHAHNLCAALAHAWSCSVSRGLVRLTDGACRLLARSLPPAGAPAQACGTAYAAVMRRPVQSAVHGAAVPPPMPAVGGHPVTVWPLCRAGAVRGQAHGVTEWQCPDASGRPEVGWDAGRPRPAPAPGAPGPPH